MTPRLKSALAGVAMLLIGPLLLKLSVFDVLEKARAHAADVSWSEKSLFIIPLCFFVGITGLVTAAMPSLWVTFDPSRRKHFGDLSPLGKVGVVALAVVLLGAGFALRAWFLSELSELGYES